MQCDKYIINTRIPHYVGEAIIKYEASIEYMSEKTAAQLLKQPSRTITVYGNVGL